MHFSLQYTWPVNWTLKKKSASQNLYISPIIFIRKTLQENESFREFPFHFYLDMKRHIVSLLYIYDSYELFLRS